jgi:predicted O-methyltransferase YrrM
MAASATVPNLLRRARSGVGARGVRGAVAEAARRAAQPALAPVAARRLREQAAHATTMDALLDLAFGFDELGVTITPGQVPSEIRALLEIVRAERCRSVLEIGTANGGSLFLFARAAAHDAHIISVDLPAGEFGGGYPPWKIPVYRAFPRGAQRLDLIRADSHASSTIARVTSLLGGRPLDFLFIDGDHSYDGVRRDFEAYAPLVRCGGLIGFHDISPAIDGATPGGPALLVGDVPRYWSELRASHEAEEFRHAPGGCFGIGLLRV